MVNLMILNTVTILDSNSKIFSNDRHMQIHTYKYTTYNIYVCVFSCSVRSDSETP